MKGFKFKLQSVLEARNKRFEDTQLEFAQVKNRLNNENKKLNFLYQDLEQTTAGLESIIQRGIIDYTLMSSHQSYILKLKADINNQHRFIEEIEKELEEKNRIMLEALKEKTMMEKLRERALESFKKELERQDLLNIDEIATNRYRRTG